MGEVEGLAWRMEETKMRGEGGKEREAEWTGRTRDPWEERRREREREPATHPLPAPWPS